MRFIPSIAVLGALVAGGALYAEPGWRKPIPGWGRPTEAGLSAEAWPVCTTTTALGDESDWAQLDQDFAAGKKALVAADWTGAIAALELAALRDPRNADIQNYIGYAHSRLRQFGPAMGYFQQALMFNPRHRRAREHLGELLLALNDLNKAEEQLAVLKEICLIPCNEFADLERGIAAYSAAAAYTPERKPSVSAGPNWASR